MPTTAAAGMMSLCEKHLADSLADCPAFQSLMGAANAAAALAKIYFNAIDNLPEPAEGEFEPGTLRDLRPFAIIHGDFPFTVSAGAFDTPLESGSLGIIIETDYPEDLLNLPSEAERRIRNSIGAIQEELLERRNT